VLRSAMFAHLRSFGMATGIPVGNTFQHLEEFDHDMKSGSHPGNIGYKAAERKFEPPGNTAARHLRCLADHSHSGCMPSVTWARTGRHTGHTELPAAVHNIAVGKALVCKTAVASIALSSHNLHNLAARTSVVQSNPAA